MFILLKFNKYKYQVFLIIILLFLNIGFYGNYITYKYKKNTYKIDENFYKYVMGKYDISIDENSRTNSIGCYYNISYLYNIKNIYDINSNIQASNFELYNSLGYNRDVFTQIPVQDKLSNDFLGIKYILDCGNNKLEQYGYKLLEKNSTYSIYVNNDSKSIGFIPKSFISQKDFDKLDIIQKRAILNESIVLKDYQIDAYQFIFENKSVNKIGKFKFIKNGFIINVESSKESLIEFIVPYDSGWSAKINNRETKIEKVSNGLMAIKLQDGENKVKFTYFPKGLKLGTVSKFIGK